MRILVLVLLSLRVEAQRRPPPPPVDMEAVRAEPQADKRYWKALEYASAQIDAAREANRGGSMDAFRSALENVAKAVLLCDDTLRGTGKNPSKNPKHFKRAELKIRELIRRLKGLEDEVGVDDRAAVAKVRAQIQEIHDELLFDIMGRRK